MGDLKYEIEIVLPVNSHTYKQERAEGISPSAQPEKSGEQFSKLI
jgi:hypothetical protein